MNTLFYTTLARFMFPCFALFALLVAQTTRAETTNCTAITSLPAVITTQGVYCFTGHLATAITSGNAIEIQANNVTIDLNGFKLGGLGAGDGTTARGIYANQRNNIVIRNGIVRGFFLGIYLDDISPFITSQGHLIEDILADRNTYRGLLLEGRGMTVRRNQVVDTGGSTSSGSAIGIRVLGPGNDILNNRISTTVATSGSGGDAYGIMMLAANGSVIQNNRVSDTQADSAAKGYGIYLGSSSSNLLIQNNSVATTQGNTTYGIYITASFFVNARENTMVTADFGIYYSAGTASGVYKDNIADNISTSDYTGGTDGGGNF